MPRKPRYFDYVYRRQYTKQNHVLQYTAKDCKELLQRLQIQNKIEVHTGCVNTIAWNESGSLLLSGADDHNLVITNPFKKYPDTTLIHTPHTANIFSAKFLSDSGDAKLVSSAGNGRIVYTDVYKQEESSSLNCHTGAVYEVLHVPGDPHSFLSCGEDGTVRWFDTRLKISCSEPDCCQDVMIQCDRGVPSISLNPVFSYELAVGCSDGCVRLYDRRMLSTRLSTCDKNTGLSGLISKFSVPKKDGLTRKITSVDFRPDGREVSASFSSDHIYIFDPKNNEGSQGRKLKVGRPSRKTSARSRARSPQPMKKLRLRGDWSDTGPNSRPEVETRSSQESTGVEPDRNNAQAALMQRMTHALSRMLNDPGTRQALHRLPISSASPVLPSLHTVVRPFEPVHDTHPTQSAPDTQPSQPAPDTYPTQPSLSAQDTHPTQPALDTHPTQPSEPAPDTYPTQPFQPGSDTHLTQPSLPASNTHPNNPSLATPDIPVFTTQRSLTAQNEELDEDEEHTEEAHNESPDLTHNNTDCDESNSTQGASALVQPLQPVSLNKSPIPAQEHAGNEDQESTNENPGVTSEAADNWSVLRRSVTNLRNSGLEPTLQFRVQDSGSSSSSIRVDSEPLPGPSRVVTGPGRVGIDPETGLRRRRHGVSSVPTSSILHGASAVPTLHSLSDYWRSGEDPGDIEYEDDSDTDLDSTGDHENSDWNPGRTILQPLVNQQLSGHRNVRTMIKEATWWGNNYILSGSDCGHLFGWDRSTAEIVVMLEADRHVVNCVQPHPTLPLVATSGIDYDIKLWFPTAESSTFDEEKAQVVSRRNEVMLEEMKDTITVPASLMIRMLASLNQIRRGQGSSNDPG